MYTFFLVVLYSCESKSQTTVMGSKAKDTQKVQALLEKFNQQEHRLEVNDCEIVYNGKSFFLGNTMEEVEAILGSYDYKNGFAHSWKNINLKAITKIESTEIENIYIYISEGYKEIIKPNDNVVLINGIPLIKDMEFKDLVESSQYTYDDFYITFDAYELRPERCDVENLYIYFDSKPMYDYIGSGHMRLRGDFNPDKSNLIKDISIFQHKD